MKWLSGIIAAALLGFAAPALATTCSSLPYNLTNGNTADATQVTANFNSLLNCLNLNVLPIASPTFTGTMNGGSLILSGNLNVTGQGTFTGTLNANGSLTVANSAIFGNGVGGSSFVAAILGGLPTYSLAAGVNIHTDGNLVLANGAGAVWVDPSGTWHIPGALIVGGAITFPAASIINADLDTTLAGGGGPCGSATTTCTLSINSQGRATAFGGVTIQPDTCVINTTSGYCKNPNGYVHQWYHFDSGSTTGWAGGPTAITFPFVPAHGCYAYSAVTDNQGGIASPYYALQITSAPGGNGVTVTAVGFQSGSHNAIEGFYVSADCF